MVTATQAAAEQNALSAAPFDTDSPSSSKASSIPAEILAFIFKTCSQQAHVLTSSERKGVRPHQCRALCLSWIPIAHVCRHWRFAALTHHELWSNITSDRRPWMKEMFLRSGEAPLTIHITCKDLSDDLEEDLIRSIPRAQELTIRADSEGEIIERILSRMDDAPALRSVSFIGASDHPESLAIPLNLVSQKARELENLHFYCSCPDWAAQPIFPSRLKRLTIYQPDSDLHPLPTCAQLAACIQQFAALEELTLCHTLPDEIVAVDNQVNLPTTLRRLSITSSVDSYLVFLSNHRTPPTLEHISVVCAGQDVFNDYIQLYGPLAHVLGPDVISAVRAFYASARGLSKPRRDSLPSSCYTEFSIGIKNNALYTTTTFWRPGQMPPETPHVAELTYICPAILVGPFVSVLERAPFIYTVRHVTINDLGNSPVVGMLIQSMQAVRSVVLNPAESRRDSFMISSAAGGLVGPELETITLQGIDFSGRHYQKEEIPSLRFALSTRGGNGYPVKKLIFKDCRNVQMGKWAKLKEQGTELVEESDDTSL
ncbi:hypothetical protein CONPUDRAFT_145038 [Coniophora puteana RWD-64-598 SS2]|uniref:Uncharacterized protein n=1 Tax=Coniophora puteana (strain RWD-64-598) TaxID=741705 RepID=A0A5M3MLP0_CONPW|nr:uncharacterized protein CONPUDRAFT_145038 [Coniophora puteana RWD-64-598 SS2]EIW79976.1 hypothetical protein CONPUDRAFT_145038 [Coniophora puteana RWD-64-598 SS2]